MRLRTTLLSLVALCGLSVVAAEEPESWKDFQIRIAVAESHLQSGKLEAALHVFVSADEMDLFEVPNYEALVGIAETKCRLGESEAGLVDLSAFLCAVRVDAGELPCYFNVFEPFGPLKNNPALDELCRSRMCGEMYLPYYESKDPEKHRELAALRERAERVRGICERSVAPKPESPPGPAAETPPQPSTDSSLREDGQ